MVDCSTGVAVFTRSILSEEPFSLFPLSLFRENQLNVLGAFYPWNPSTNIDEELLLLGAFLSKERLWRILKARIIRVFESYIVLSLYVLI